LIGLPSLLVVAALLLLGCESATACLCGGIDNKCSALKPDAYAIFLGRVISKEVGNGANADGSISSVVPSLVRFAVTEAYRGIGSAEVEIATTEGCCACGYPFEVGHDYLVYATRFEGKLTTGICSPTQPAVTAGALIRQFRALQTGAPAASVFGEIMRVPRDARIEGREAHTPIAGVVVRLQGTNGSDFTAQSDPDGVFEFDALPPDTYEVHPLLPLGVTTREQHEGKPVKLTVTASNSCQADIAVYSDGRISGRVVDLHGKAVPGFVTVELADSDEQADATRKGGLPGFDTGTDARFELSLLWPGRYRLKFVPTGGHFDRGSYFPHSIDLAEGQHVDNVVFVYMGSHR
jgi:hypothetical protein